MRYFPANGDKERAVDVPVWGIAVLLWEQEKHLVAKLVGVRRH